MAIDLLRCPGGEAGTQPALKLASGGRDGRVTLGWITSVGRTCASQEWPSISLAVSIAQQQFTVTQAIHEQGLVSVLRQIHDELDTAVADAYGWPVDLTDEQILERLVA